MRKQLIVMGVLAIALVLPVLPASSATAMDAAVAPPGSDTSEVLLPTGDPVLISHIGNTTSASVLTNGATGIGHTYVGLRAGADQYEIPVVALPYLGHGLDMSLFDVTALAATGTATTVPLRVAYSGDTPTVPGLTVTVSTADSVSGYLTKSGTAQFATTLTQRYRSDKAHNSLGRTGLFGSATVSAAGRPTPRQFATVSPDFVMHTVTITGDEADGTPSGEASVVLVNVDDVNRLTVATSLFQGSAKVSAPAGNYLAFAGYFGVDAAGDITDEHMVVDPQLAIAGDQTVRLDAAQATSKLTVVTPRPSVDGGGVFNLIREDTNGVAREVSFPVAAGVPVWVSPATTPVSVGTMFSYPRLWLTSPPGPGTPYAYDLQFPATGVLPQQRYVVRARDLATREDYFYSEFPTTGVLDSLTQYPIEAAVGGASDLIPMIDLPVHQTIYVPGDPALARQDLWVKYLTGGALYNGWQLDTFTSYQAGSTVRENWNKFPLHPAAMADLGVPGDTPEPGAVRTGDTESFFLRPFSDSQPGHTGSGFVGQSEDTITGSWALDQNGTRIAGDSIDPAQSAFDAQVPVSADPATLHLTLDAGRTGPLYALSTASHTEWTWRSVHQADTAIPAPWVCSDEELDGDCTVEPLLTLGYDVDGMSLDGSVPSGRWQGVHLSVGHLQFSAAARITGASLEFSTDDGTIWRHAATIASGSGRYLAAFPAGHTAPGTYVSLRVTAHDAAGGAITETITRAYRLS